MFLDRSRKTGRTAIAWQEGKNWRNFVSSGHSSTQRAELFTAIMILWQWPQEHLNIDCDSGYTVYTILHLDQASIKTSIDHSLLNLFVTLQSLLDKQEHPLFITHVGSHSGLPSPLVDGNNKVDTLVSVLTAFQQAAASHQFFHQNSQAPQKQFDFPHFQAKSIIKECPDCQAFTKAPPSTGVNPRGLSSQMIRQTHVTHYPHFGKFKYIHISIDTYSGELHASALTGESAKNIEACWLKAFHHLRQPQQIKTDNGPGYLAHSTQVFLQRWNIQHKTGIP